MRLALTTDRFDLRVRLASAVGLAGALLAFACTLPQAAKLTRMHTAAGVSVAALANSTISGLAWTAFGVLQHERTDLWGARTALTRQLCRTFGGDGL